MQKIADGIGDEFVTALKEKVEGKKAPGPEVTVAKKSSTTTVWLAVGAGLAIAAAIYYVLF